ncbi:ABC transporter ATP-binding protein/permease [Vibrio sp. JC009]|uniref:ABC transporter ATP-binding protein n=1 Tax=Vibrio sp. JC009 TaxID=2912314 RepID=UPI0023AF0FAF|nr:ABC transporter ATP-binding protein [Vibrio sp. JC009]WED24690.1 ABC transporter ATP-binding protein/permease [Vibrio sp. JC009]
MKQGIDSHATDNPQIRSELDSMKQLWKVTGPQRRHVLAGIAFRFAQSFCLGLSFAVVIHVLGQLADGATMTYRWTWLITGVMFISLLGQLVCGYFSATYSWQASFDVAGMLRLSLLEHLKNLPLGFHLSRSKGDTISVLTSDMQMLESFMSDALPRIAQAFGLPVAVLGYLFYLDWPVAVSASASIMISIPVYLWSSRQLAKLGIKRQDTQADASASMIEFAQGIAVIRAFNRLDKGMEKFHVALSAFRDISIQAVVKLTAPLVTFAAIVMCGVPVLIMVSGTRFLAGDVDTSTVIAALVLAFSLYSPLVGLIAVMEVTRMADASLSRINRIINARPLSVCREPVEPEGFAIRFEDVGFSYDKGKPVLSNLCFSVPERSVTAIVGLSGSGKSTILNLLPRFWDVESGKITLGGADIKMLAPEELHQMITIVFQDVYLFSGSIYENIAFGSPTASAEEIIQAAKSAQAHEFIEALPEGYDTRVGEGGAALSGGERQRISIARAILKDAPVVLMDEATAAIDPTNERAIQSALSALVKDKTLIIVAHRLSTVQSADQILVLENGQIAESGTHKTLLDGHGLYHKLWERWSNAADWKIKTH